jgi:hypothetical protein
LLEVFLRVLCGSLRTLRLKTFGFDFRLATNSFPTESPQLLTAENAEMAKKNLVSDYASFLLEVFSAFFAVLCELCG